MIAGPARDWLASRRGELNARFQAARRRHGGLDGPRVLQWLAETLPPMAGSGEPGSDALLQAVYDLVLLQVGRGRLGPIGSAEGGPAAIPALLRETFPRLRPLLLQQPGVLPGTLSNAVENLGDRGLTFAREIGALGTVLRQADQLLSAGAVLAWRLGEARLRERALSAAEALPAKAVLAALGTPALPEPAAPLLLAGLRSEAWRRPDRILSPATVDRLPALSPRELEALKVKVAARAGKTTQPWRIAGLLGEFAGFGGSFEEPPLLLDAGARGSRHRFFAMGTEGVFRLDADGFGWVCRPDPEADFPVQAVAPRPGALKTALLGDSGKLRLSDDGTLSGRDLEVRVPRSVGAGTFVAYPDLVAFTTPDSFRVRVAVPAREPV